MILLIISNLIQGFAICGIIIYLIWDNRRSMEIGEDLVRKEIREGKWKNA